MKNQKQTIACIIQARTGSKRFPKKILTKIKNKTILEHIISFLKFSKYTDKIIIATSILKEDDIVEDIAKENGVAFFRGDENDVLSRYFYCAKKFNIDIIVRITADNPLIDPEIVDTVIEEIVSGKYDYVSNMIKQTYPLGYLVEAMTFQTLKKIHVSKTDSENREHVTPSLRSNEEKFKIKNISTLKEFDRHEWRLTLDYKEDLKLIKIIFDKLFKPNEYIKYERVVELIDENNSLLDINKNLR